MSQHVNWAYLPWSPPNTAIFAWVTDQIEGCGRTVPECLKNAFAHYRSEIKNAGENLTTSEQEDWSHSLFQGELVLLVLPESVDRAQEVLRALVDRGDDELWKETIEQLFPKN